VCVFFRFFGVFSCVFCVVAGAGTFVLFFVFLAYFCPLKAGFFALFFLF